MAFGSPDGEGVCKGLRVRCGSGRDDIMAARDGRVAYAGVLGGWGQTLVLEHSENFVTVYSGRFQWIARPGQRLRQGETLARFDPSAKDNRELYFEIRKEAEALDPLDYLRPSGSIADPMRPS